MEMIRAIIIEHEQEARESYIYPNEIPKIIGGQIKRTNSKKNENDVVLFSSKLNKNEVRRGNRAILNNSMNIVEVLYGTIIATGYNYETEEIRGLTDDECMECMIEFREPILNDYHWYGLKSGEELKINELAKDEFLWTERKPDKIVVAKEYKYFISCEGIWKSFGDETRIRFSINKPIDKERRIVRVETGDVLK